MEGQSRVCIMYIVKFLDPPSLQVWFHSFISSKQPGAKWKPKIQNYSIKKIDYSKICGVSSEIYCDRQKI